MDANDHATREQPAPMATTHPVIWDQVVEDIYNFHWLINDLTRKNLADDIRSRDTLGRQRYGVGLTPHNGRDQLVDAYQEIIDAVGYLACAMMEFRKAKSFHAGTADSLYWDAMQLALDVRWLIDRREELGGT